MTAMFSVIFIKAMEKRENRISGVIGVMSTLISLIIFGKTVFLIPSMVLIIVFLFLFRKKKIKFAFYVSNRFFWI